MRIKRVITLALLLCFVVAMIPTPWAQAADVVNEVGIVTNDFPAGGKHPFYNDAGQENMVSIFHGDCQVDASVTGAEGWVNGVMWRDTETFAVMSASDTFQTGKVYALNVCIKPGSGCDFPENASDMEVKDLCEVKGGATYAPDGLAKGKMVLTFAIKAAAPTSTVNIQLNHGGYHNPGKVTGSGTYETGSQITLKATPSMGFAFYGWSGEGDRFISSDPEMKVLVYRDLQFYADFVKAPFDDICGSDYYYLPVIWAVEEGVTNGTSATTFSPNQPCTRAQAVTFIWRRFGCPTPNVSGRLFEDTDENAYYAEALAWATEKGIVVGTSATTFSPNQPCTRAQIVTFIWRALGRKDLGDVYNPFVDVPANEYYTDAVLYAYYGDITNGTTATTFSPHQLCTRGQIVTFLWRSMSKG